MKHTGIAVLSLIVCLKGFAVSYFVDFSGGSDAASGTATSTPWKHCPGDASATGTAASTTLAAGDAVNFKGGVTYSGMISCSFNGTAGNPIIYDGNSAGSFGTGVSIIDGGYLNSDTRRYGFTINAKKGITIRNFTIQHQGGLDPATFGSFDCSGNPLPNSNGVGIYARDATNLVVSDCLFKEISYWTNGAPVSDALLNGSGAPFSGGFVIYSGDTVTITNCEFTKLNEGIQLQEGSPASSTVLRNVTVANCSFHDYMRWMIALSAANSAGTFDGITVTNCQFYNFPQYSADYWNGCGGAGSNPHTDGIILGVFTSASESIVYTNIVIAANTFWTDYTNGGSTAWIFWSSMGGDVKIFNNVCLNDADNSFGWLYFQDGPALPNTDTPITVSVYNNTVCSTHAAIYLRRNLGTQQAVDSGIVRVENNIFYHPQDSSSMIVSTSGCTNNLFSTLDYNVYFTGRPDGLIFNQFNSSPGPVTNDFEDVAGLVSKYSYETHGKQGVPGFVDFSHGFGTGNLLNNVRLLSSSRAVGAGVNFSSLFTSDIVWNTRVTPWDIGAYKYQPPSAILGGAGSGGGGTFGSWVSQ